jgi:hypothetical protein
MLTIRSIVGEPIALDLQDFVCACPNTLIYGSPRFMNLVSRHLEAQSGWLEARRGGAIVGVLPFMRKDGFLGPVYNSLAYYGSNGAVIQYSKDEEAKSSLVEAFYDMANRAGSVSATIITNPLEVDAEFYKIHTHYDFLDERIGQITHLTAGIDAEGLMRSFEDPRPRNIRRAIRDGITVERRQDSEAIDFLYDTHVKNMEAIGGRAKKRSFFDSMQESMDAGDWSIYLAKKDGQAVAALLLFNFNRTVEYFTPVIREEFRSTQALSLIIYQAKQGLIRQGFINRNWGGTWLSQGGVYDFKKRWGTTEYPYYYFTRVFNADVCMQSKEALLKNYEGFYVLPFSGLVTA